MRASRSIVIAASLFAAIVSAQAQDLHVAALKGPTGIGMIGLFESPPPAVGGVGFSLSALPSADLMIAKLATKEVDIAVLPVNLAAKLYNTGLPLHLLAVVGGGMINLVTSDSSVTRLADLKGKEVYVAGQGATPEFLLRYLLRTEGVDPDKDLKLIFSMPYPEMAMALAAGKIAYAVLPEPFTTMALKANPKLLLPLDFEILFGQRGGEESYPMSVVVALQSAIDRAPKAIEAFLKAYEASIAFVIGNPVAAGALVEKHDLGMKAEVAASAIPRSNFKFTLARHARKEIEALLSVFLALAPKSIGGKLPDDAFYAGF